MSIAYSVHSNIQVRLETLTLKQMWKNKIGALKERMEIRDAYDLEFILKKGGAAPEKEREKIIKILDNFISREFKVTLGSLLSAEQRAYYNKYGFKTLKNYLQFQV